MDIKVTGGEMSLQEQNEYVKMLRHEHPAYIFRSIHFHIDGDYVDASYEYDTVPFQRIRRITGYLVGTLDRFNDGKRAEEHDRVKHNV